MCCVRGLLLIFIFFVCLFLLQYKFSLEKRILSGQVYQAPSCPPYWLLFYSPQDSRRSRRRSHRSRSHSLSAEDSHRTVKFLVPDSEDEDGYYDDNEGSSDDARRPIKMRERPWSAAPKDPIARVKDMELGPSTCHCRPVSPQSARGQRGTLPSRQDSRQSLRPLQTSPLLGQKSTKKRTRSLGPVGRKPPQNTPPPSRPQQQRPSSAGPAWKNRKQVDFFFLSVSLKTIFIKPSSLFYNPLCLFSLIIRP